MARALPMDGKDFTFRQVLRGVMIGIWCGLAIFMTVVWGCAGTGRGSFPSKEKVDRPDWIDRPPENTDMFMYFVGSGRDAGGDEAAAHLSAGMELADKLVRLLAAEAGEEGNSDSRIFTSYKEELAGRVMNTAPDGPVRVMDTWVERNRDDSSVEAYLLVRWDVKALDEAGERLQALIRTAPVSGPEEEGDISAASGDLYGAIVQYLTAAAAIETGSGHSPAAFDRVITKATDALDRMRMGLVSSPGSTFVGVPFSEGFRVKILKVGESGEPALPSVAVTAVTETVVTDTQVFPESVRVLTDDGGVALFTPQPPAFAGKYSVRFDIDFDGALQSLMAHPRPYADSLEKFMTLAASKGIDVPYTVYARATDVSTGVMIIDADRGNNPTGTAHAASQAAQVLAEAGYRIVSLPLQPELMTLTPSQIVTRLDRVYGSEIERVVFGVVRIVDFQDRDGRYTVKVSGDIRMIDLPTGEVLFSTTDRVKTALGPSTTTAISAAFKGFGELIGEVLVNAVP